ncbi:hypothetical protein SAMN05216343_10359 [Oscillibacter sp. PC13]|uniref:hypothetical protein n=1 Tax=Oscillibacter sp. PC13 TaxID=1855299 RepID=UPI0008ECED34|nr:hypothetical protein [Oscillibacter sp. PC13]SFP10185.1 hypothetical protein SAMN05216343_10359 [Oscillibacter sp. PC13]
MVYVTVDINLKRVRMDSDAFMADLPDLEVLYLGLARIQNRTWLTREHIRNFCCACYLGIKAHLPGCGRIVLLRTKKRRDYCPAAFSCQRQHGYAYTIFLRSCGSAASF